jgi:DNA-binding MarR family transcriptional regulator
MPPPGESKAGTRTTKRQALRKRPGNGRDLPKTVDFSNVDLDIFGDLLSFYIRTLYIAIARDLDARMEDVPVARGTGKISTLLLVEANPGIRPSVIAHYSTKDRSAMVRIIDQLRRAGLLKQNVSSKERRARELFITPKGRQMARRVREIALAQSADFFAVLTEPERQALHKIVSKVYRHVIGESGAL